MEKDIELQYKLGKQSKEVNFFSMRKVSLCDISEKDKDGNFHFKIDQHGYSPPRYIEVTYNFHAYVDAWYFGRILTDGEMCVQIREEDDGTCRTCNHLHDPTPDKEFFTKVAEQLYLLISEVPTTKLKL